MTTIQWPLLVQTFLLLLGAFGAGCAIACLFRRMFFADARTAAGPRRVAEERAAIPAVAPRETPATAAAPREATRFDRALGVDAEPATSRSSGHVPVVEVQQPAPRITPAPQSTATQPGTSGQTGAPASGSPMLPGAPIRPAQSPAIEVRPSPQAAPATPLAAAQAPAAPASPAPVTVRPVTPPASQAPAAPASTAASSAVSVATAQAGQPASVPAKTTAGTASATPATVPSPPRIEPRVTIQPPVSTTPVAPHPTVSPSTVPSGAASGAATAVAAAAAAAASAAAARVQAPSLPASPAAPVATPPAAASLPADDLTLIRAIDTGLQDRLNRLGLRRYDQIAAWTAGDVNRMSQSLGFAGRIEQENWIEQAQILAKGGQTEYSRRRGGAPNDRPAAPASTAAATGGTPAKPANTGSPVVAPATAVPAAPAVAPKVTPAPAATPAASAPASPSTAAGARPFGVLPKDGADAAAAAAAAAIAAAAAGTVRTPPPPATAAPVAASPAATTPRVSAADAGPALGVPVQEASGTGDRLHRILGINAEAERLLIANGVTRFSQIAAWTTSDIERFDTLLGKPGRISRENWVEQAKVLVRSAQEAEAPRPARLADAIRENAEPRAAPPRSDLGHLRSVRSEALRGEMSDGARPSILSRSVGSQEDLKRIRGIGVLIEKKLNSLGITGYEQIANWTGADIDRISQILDFKGRIERENWIEQARILAAGGHTEFSRRVDRGDVDSSKPVR